MHIDSILLCSFPSCDAKLIHTKTHEERFHAIQADENWTIMTHSILNVGSGQDYAFCPYHIEMIHKHQQEAMEKVILALHGNNI